MTTNQTSDDKKQREQSEKSAQSEQVVSSLQAHIVFRIAESSLGCLKAETFWSEE
jgi:hypothetical protein